MMKSRKNLLAPAVLFLVVLILFWFSFIRPSVTLSDWKISNDGSYYASTSMPHYSYHTVVPYLYFKGDLVVPSGIEDYVLSLSVDGCLMGIKVNNQYVYGNDYCNSSVPYDERSIDLSGKLNPGGNEVDVKIIFDGGTTRFEVLEDRKYNLLRFSLIAVLLSAIVYLLVKNFRYVFSTLLLSLVFIHVFSSRFSVNWGYKALQAFPLHVDLILALIAVLIAVPFSYDALASVVQKGFSKFCKKAESTKKQVKSKPKQDSLVKSEVDSLKSYLTYFFVSLLSFLVFWIFRARHSMGDSGFVGQIALDDRSMFFHGSSLSAWTLSFAYRLLKNFGFAFSSYDSAALVSCFFGALAIPALWVICRELFDSLEKRLMLFSIVVSAYFMQLFFGYIEFYPMLVAAMIYYTLAGVYYLKDKASILFPSIAFAVMVCFHLSSIYLAPSLIMLYIYKVFRRKEKVFSGMLKMFLPVSIICFLFFSYVIFIHEACNQGFIDCMKGYASGIEQYASDSTGGGSSLVRHDMLTLNFIQEILTEYIYISPGAVLLFFLLIAFYILNINFKDPYLMFLLVSATTFFPYTLTHITALGLPMDWDALAPIGLPLTMFVGYALINTVKDRKLLRYYTISLISVVLLIHTAPALLDNADMEYVLSNPQKLSSNVMNDFAIFFVRVEPAVNPETLSSAFVDSLDIGDSASEIAHSYVIQKEVENGSRKASYSNGTVLEDNYRSFNDYESFIVSSKPKKNLVIMKRVKCPTSQVTRAYLHGYYLGNLNADCKNSEEMWKDIEITAPGSLIGGGKVGLMFVSDNKEPVESYYYRFYSI